MGTFTYNIDLMQSVAVQHAVQHALCVLHGYIIMNPGIKKNGHIFGGHGYKPELTGWKYDMSQW